MKPQKHPAYVVICRGEFQSEPLKVTDWNSFVQSIARDKRVTRLLVLPRRKKDGEVIEGIVRGMLDKIEVVYP